MSKCTNLKECAFYNNKLVGVNDEAKFLKELYCMKKSEKCARVIMSGEKSLDDTNNYMNPIGMNYKADAQI